MNPIDSGMVPPEKGGQLSALSRQLMH